MSVHLCHPRTSLPPHPIPRMHMLSTHRAACRNLNKVRTYLLALPTEPRAMRQPAGTRRAGRTAALTTRETSIDKASPSTRPGPVNPCCMPRPQACDRAIDNKSGTTQPWTEFVPQPGR